MSCDYLPLVRDSFPLTICPSMNSANWKKLSLTLKPKPTTMPDSPTPTEPIPKSETDLAIEQALSLTELDRQQNLPTDPTQLQLDRTTDTDTEDILDTLADLPTHGPDTCSTENHIPDQFRPKGNKTLPGTLLDWFTYLDSIEHSATNTTKLGTYIGIDCEMVGVGPLGIQSALARVTLINFHGHVLLDTLVKPQEQVTDFRTMYSGIKSGDLNFAPSFQSVVTDVAKLIKDRILVGHDLVHDLRALMLSHDKEKCRDTRHYPGLQTIAQTKAPKLSVLTKIILGVTIQDGAHNSADDARAAMLLYRLYRHSWEQSRVKTYCCPDTTSSSKKRKSSAFWSKNKKLKKEKKAMNANVN